MSEASPEASDAETLSLLAVTCRSAALRLAWFEMPAEILRAEARIEGIGGDDARISLVHRAWGHHVIKTPVHDLQAGIAAILPLLRQVGLDRPDALAHKLTHAGEHFSGTVRISSDVLAAMRAWTALAPRQNPADIAGVEACADLLPGVPQYGVFETGFFRALPWQAAVYALPYHWSRDFGIRRYGAHGIAHSHALARASEILGRAPSELRGIFCHLDDDGSSICAVRGGRPIAISSGFSAHSGLVSPTAPGDFDPGVLPYVADALGMRLADISALVGQESGLLGVSGISGDVRELETAAVGGDERARLALDLYIRAARHYLGAYAVELGGLDVLTFSGRIVEACPLVRAAICRDLEFVGIHLDPARNAACHGTEAILSPGCWPVRVLALLNDEERSIARDVARFVAAARQADHPDRHSPAIAQYSNDRSA